MILTTTDSIEGFKIVDYLGIVTGVALNDKMISGGLSVSKYYKKLQESIDTVKEEAFQRLRENAQQLQANAIVGIKIDIEYTSSNYAIVSITGTAVKVLV